MSAAAVAIAQHPRYRPGMLLEHTAFNVPDPVQQADWWVQHLGMKITYQGPPPAHGRFLADERGAMVELYHNPEGVIPEYHAISHITLHVAFRVDDPAARRERLLAAGAIDVHPQRTDPAGNVLAMVRDPWGVALQFVRRPA